MKDGSGVKDAVVVLKNPKLEADQLTFDVDVLEGDLKGADGAASTFIDIIGRPLTPLSFAGVARRTAWRRAYYAGAAAAVGQLHIIIRTPMEPTIGRLAATIPIRPAIRTEAPAVMRRFGTLHASAAALFVAVIGFPQRSTLTPDDPMRACGTTNRFAIVCAQKTETTLEFFHPRGSSNSQWRALTMHVIFDKIRARAVSP